MKNILTQLIIEYTQQIFFYGIERNLLSKTAKFINNPEIIALSGVRRSGKSVLFNQLIRYIDKKNNCLLINFEDERLKEFRVEHFDLLLEAFYEKNNPQGTVYLFFDEIQEISGWEKWVRRIYDKKQDIKFFITGSSSSLMSSEFSTLLTGRNISFMLYPFNFKEFLNYKKYTINIDKIKADIKEKSTLKSHLNDYINTGGFPAVTENYSIELLQQYFKDIIYRDIIRRYHVRDVKQLEELYIYLISNISNLYTYNKIKNSFKMGIDTVKEYINYGISSNLFFDHLFFSYSLKESFNKPRKSYCIDNGLRNAVSFKFSDDLGRLVENQVNTELLRRYNNSYYYKNKNEVDFVVKNEEQQLLGINVCYSNNIPEREFSGLLELKKEYPERTKDTFIISEDLSTEINNIKIIPYWEWLLMPS